MPQRRYPLLQANYYSSTSGLGRWYASFVLKHAQMHLQMMYGIKRHFVKSTANVPREGMETTMRLMGDV
jgi:hypothetical protein